MSRRPALALVTPCHRCQKREAVTFDNDEILTTGSGQHVCWDCHDEWRATPEGMVRAQTNDAQDALERDAAGYLTWPWDDVARITLPMAPGTRPYFFCAFAGNGKTTFSWSAVDRWTDAGVIGYVLSLETTAPQWRVGLACTRLGISPALALSGELRRREQSGDRSAAHDRERIAAELDRQYKVDADTLHVSPLSMLTQRDLVAEFKNAKAVGARYILIDHIDHVTGDGRSTPVAESMSANRALVDLSQRYEVIPVVASQLNMDVTKTDHLGKYRPPRDADLMFPAVKNQVAQGIIGLYRPIDEAADPETLAAAKRGEIDPYTAGVLKPNTMGVVVIKAGHEFGSAHRGARCTLAVRQGRVMTHVEADHESDLYAQRHGPAAVRSAHPERRDAA
jgi:hypothetical protein